MLVHKVNGEHPTSYSDLVFVAQKLERWEEATDALLLKTITTGGSNVNQSQTSGNLFLSRKLNSNCTFTVQTAIVESTEAEEDLSAKSVGKEEAESLAGEDA